MRLLAIETATTVCAAAVVADGKVLAEASLNEKYVHAEMLMLQVDAVLRDASAPPNTLDAIAVSIGPGSFTGLRIGLSVAKGLAYALGKKLIAVPTLRALALGTQSRIALHAGEILLAALNARRDEVYAEYFSHKEGGLVSLNPVCDLTLSKLRSDAPDGHIIVTGDAVGTIAGFIGSADSRWRFLSANNVQCTASSVGLLGATMAARGEFADVATLEPLYIKDFLFRQQA
jgi:tRNA threonylcarbamoyladenosine biosynthesis protein TsaB